MFGYLTSPETPRHPCVGAGALCYRRRVEPCGTRALGGGASALLQLFAAGVVRRASPAVAEHVLRTRRGHRPRQTARTQNKKSTAVTPSSADGVKLPSNLVAYQAPTTTSSTASDTPHDGAANDDDNARAVDPRRRHRPPLRHRLPPPRRRHRRRRTVAAHSEGGEATWYSAAPAGMCASPTLPFGTVLTVVNNTTGASTECTVDDREAAGYPHVVDISPSGFSQIGSLGQGVVDVTISW